MKALVTLEDGKQFHISRTHITELDELGRETKRQCTLRVAPVLKPGIPLVYGCKCGEITTKERITGVIWRG